MTTEYHYIVRFRGKPVKVTDLAHVAVTTAERYAAKHNDVAIQVPRKVEK